MNRRLACARWAGAAAIGGALAAASIPALGDVPSERIRALERQLETSLQLIEKLAARVAELERAAGTPSPAKKPDAVAA